MTVRELTDRAKGVIDWHPTLHEERELRALVIGIHKALIDLNQDYLYVSEGEFLTRYFALLIDILQNNMRSARKSDIELIAKTTRTIDGGSELMARVESDPQAFRSAISNAARELTRRISA